MKKTILLLTFIALGAGSVFAQGYTSLHYDISFPMGATSDAVGRASFIGFGLDYRKFVKPNVGVGFSLGWQVFNERKDFATYTDGTVSLSGVQYSYVNAIPIHANINYNFREDGDTVRPFIGTGIGTTYVERQVDMGMFSSVIETWQFSIQPEVGLRYEIVPNTSAFVGAKYTQCFKNDELDAQSYISLNFGFAWSL